MTAARPTAHPQPPLRPATLAVHAGRPRPVPGDPLIPGPTFASAFHAGGARGYARDGNPTWEAFESAIGTLEDGHAVAFSSGMAAATAVLESLPPTARVLAAGDAYVEARRLLGEREADGRLRVGYVDAIELDAVLAELPGADVLWIDALSNPGLDVPELDRLAAAARESGATVVVDATLATPMLVRPLARGADLVLHSATKYMGGHSDLLLGVVAAADAERAARLRDSRAGLGSVPGTMEAWLGLRGLRTLPLRIERGAETAMALAGRLAAHPAVTTVRYPGLASDPAHRAASRLFDGYGAVLSFEVRGGAERADALCAAVRLITHATSLGGVETLIERPARWHHERDVPSGLLRLSAGCEHPEDVWDDLERALEVSQPDSAAGSPPRERARSA